jgi:hypothetical protein
VRNPFRTEAEAFRFLLLTVLGGAAIVVASVLGGAWAGVPVFVAVVIGAFLIYVRSRPERPEPTAPTRATPEGERRILVVANETVAGTRLREEIVRLAEDVQENVLVVAPALNSPLRHWASDEDGARAAAQQRLDGSVDELRRLGVNVRGEIGDSDPLQAIEDALRTFGADCLIISTHPEGRSNWLERGVVSGARERFTVPITHVVVDLQTEGVPSQ